MNNIEHTYTYYDSKGVGIKINCSSVGCTVTKNHNIYVRMINKR